MAGIMPSWINYLSAIPMLWESIMFPVWIEERCPRCGACVGICPENALGLKTRGIVVDKELCTGCGSCIRMCPVRALKEGV